ncbi:unnamed protein product [Brugia pahangi]|uniref:Ovule protein n=1 Tax=Brugia pahangi TaxID=6280 RepID=A0A0N4TWA8_BRUPA|nr:unnamed protein product [Brugia pahangi]
MTRRISLLDDVLACRYICVGWFLVTERLSHLSTYQVEAGIDVSAFLTLLEISYIFHGIYLSNLVPSDNIPLSIIFSLSLCLSKKYLFYSDSTRERTICVKYDAVCGKDS